MAIQCAENPFRDCADPGSAIPSSGCDRALAILEQAIVAQRSPLVLLGPVGGGKTLLLRRIVERPPPSIRTIFLPWLNVSAEEVIPWIRAFEGNEASQDNFVTGVQALHAGGVRTLLLVDEAQSIPRDSAERLAELARGAEGGLQVLFAGTDGCSLQAAVAAFGGGAEYVELSGEVTPEEVARWVRDTLNPDQLSLLPEPDCVELVQKVKGIPRLVRWELERRFATEEIPAAVREDSAETLGSELPTQPATSEEVVFLPNEGPPPQATLPPRSTLEMRLEALFDAAGTLLGRLTAGFRSIREACREALGVGRRYAFLLGRRFGPTANEIRNAATVRVKRMASTAAHTLADVSVRGKAALRAARRWSARGSERFAQSAGRAWHRLNEAARRDAATLGRVVFHGRSAAEKDATLRFTPLGASAIRGAATRGAERARQLVPLRGGTPASRPGSKGAGARWRIPEMRAGPLAVFAIVAAMAFLLGRVTALPTPGGASRSRAIVPSAPPPAGLGVEKERASAAQTPEGAGSTHQRVQEAGPLQPGPAPPPQARNAHHTTPAPPKRVVVKIEARPRARIWVDGHDVGRTPLTRVPLAPGRHSFQVLFADGRKMHRTLEIHHGTHVVKFS